MNCSQHVNCKCSKLPIYTMHQFLRLHTNYMVQMVHMVQNLVHLEHLTWIASIDINSWTIWFRWNLLSPSWIEFGIHPWCTPLISAHCITIPPKTSSSPPLPHRHHHLHHHLARNRILRMIIMQMPRGKVGSYAIRKIFLTKVFHLRLDQRWKDFWDRRDFPLAQHSFAFSF